MRSRLANTANAGAFRILLGLGVGEEKQPTLQVNLIPFEMEEFPKATVTHAECEAIGAGALWPAAPSSDAIVGVRSDTFRMSFPYGFSTSDIPIDCLRCCRIHSGASYLAKERSDAQGDHCAYCDVHGAELRPAVYPGETVLGFREVFGLGLCLVCPQPHQFLTGQEPFAAVLLELHDPPGGVHALGHDTAAPSEGVHAADNGQDAVGLERGRLELPMQPRDLHPCDLVGLAGPEFRLDGPLEQVPVEGDGPRLAECARKIHASNKSLAGSPPVTDATPLSEAEMIRLVHDYVDRMDERSRKRLADNPPASEDEKREMIKDAGLDAQIIRDRDDSQGDRGIYLSMREILETAGRSIDDPSVPSAAFAGLVRRARMELDNRQLARLADDHRQTFFDQLFNPTRRPEVTFGQLADQFLQLTEEEAAANRTSPKWVDKQTANVALIREIVGDSTPVHTIDYDDCLRVRSTVARIPANRTKIYGTRPLDEAIERAAADNKPLLSPVTQQQYIAALRDVLDLAAKKRLIPVNPAEGLQPLKRDTTPDGQKRQRFLRSRRSRRPGGEPDRRPAPAAARLGSRPRGIR
jgi:hypothetical protein